MASHFMQRWNIPNSVGALDGKHIAIHKPHRSGSMFFNYKKVFSVVLLALVDADYKFICVDLGAIFRSSGLSKALECNSLNLPQDSVVQGIEGNVPFFVVADEAFSAKRNLIKPFCQRHLTIRNRIFNYRCSRARRVAENAFGILANRFRISQRAM